MVYQSQGTLVTDKREIAIDETWDTQTDWEAYQSISNCDITNGIVTLASGPSSTITRPSDNNSTTATDYEGEVLNPNTSLSRVDVEVSANTSGISQIAIYDSGGTQLAVDTTVSTAGDVAVLDGLSLSSGVDYPILAYNGGNSYTFGYETDGHPYTAADGDLVRAVNGSSPGSVTDTGQVRVINNVDLYV